MASGPGLANQGVTSAPCWNNTGSTCIYAVGGTGSGGIPILNLAEMYNPATNAWTGLPGMNSTRAYFAATSGPCPTNVNNTCVYAIGGENNSFQFVNSAETYDPTSDTWTTINPMSVVRSNEGAASGPCQGNTESTCVYAIGGEGDYNAIIPSVEMYETNNNITVSVAASGAYGTSPNITLAAGDPAITVSPSSLSGALSGTLTCATTATASSHVSGGPYSVSGCSGLSAPNFKISYDYADSSYTVQPAALTVAALPQTVSYGSDFDHGFTANTVSVSGIQAGDTLASLNGSISSPDYTVGDNPGSYHLDASISDSDYTPNYAAGTLYVNRAQSSTGVALTSGNNPSTYGDSLTFTATVTSGATGTVDFWDGTPGSGVNLGSTAVSGGQATATTSQLGAGNHTIYALYSGDGVYQGSEGSMAQTVSPKTSDRHRRQRDYEVRNEGTANRFQVHRIRQWRHTRGHNGHARLLHCRHRRVRSGDLRDIVHGIRPHGGQLSILRGRGLGDRDQGRHRCRLPGQDADFDRQAVHHDLQDQQSRRWRAGRRQEAQPHPGALSLLQADVPGYDIHIRCGELHTEDGHGRGGTAVRRGQIQRR